MTQIDWNEAPEWAIGHGLIVSGSIKQVWFGEKAYMVVGDSRSYVYGGGTSETRHNHMRDSIQFQQLKPEQWTGSGLPPVGTLCEMHIDDGDLWIAGRVIAYAHLDEETVAVAHNESDVFHGSIGDFRLIRTPAQIAADEREKTIDDLKTVFDSISHELCATSNKYLETLFGAIHEAGYRKMMSDAEEVKS